MFGWFKSERRERQKKVRRDRKHLSRIAQLDQRTALPDQCLHSAEADVRPPRRKSGFDPKLSSITRAHCDAAMGLEARCIHA